jgi:predicted secreted protein
MHRWVLLCFGLVALAASPAASHSEVDARNRVSFQVEAKREVANDWATARFSVLAEGKDSAVVSESVNTQMARALAIAEGTKGFEIQSDAYTTQPIYEKGRIVRWRARQELRVAGGDVDRLAKLIGKLQGESVTLSGIDFSVKSETRKAIEEALIAEALASFRARASLVSKGMDESSWSLISLSINGSGARPRVMHARAESNMMSKAAPPAFEAGTSEIRIRVDGQIELD